MGTNSGFSKLDKSHKDRQIETVQRILSLETPLQFIFHALCNSFHSIIHELYSSLSATIDWAWATPKLFYSWYRLTCVGEIFRWLALAILSHLAPRLRKEY